MEAYKRHQVIWSALQTICRGRICRKFNMTFEELHQEGPVLLIPNHVTAWDPLLVAMSLRKKHVYYVASEHIFRLGAVSRLLEWALAPIARRKASSGADTVKACLRQLREGHSVCLFAEGEQSWTGENHPVFPATGKLAKISGATLVTYRLEGAYLSCPRWGRGIRRGRIYGHPVGIYPPERLKDLSPQQIDALIEQDIRESAWERQEKDPVAYRGKHPAEGMERALYLCPGCRKIGTLQTRGDRVFCTCGLSLRYTETGFFAPAQPFAHLGQWDDWQQEILLNRAFVPESAGVLFSDEHVQLSWIENGHKNTVLQKGKLFQTGDALVLGENCFPLKKISSMAMVLSDRLLFTVEDTYYELLAKDNINFRKYLELWKGE